MLILHISDIHFRSPNCANPDLDPDRPYRTRLIQDARARSDELGPVGAILVGGDVAFKGDRAEYAAALEWLRELAEAVKCPLERVFVVPGNHDVDRRVIIDSPATRNAQNAIINATPHLRESELRIQFADSETGRALLAPLAAYNEFAAQFSCQIYPPDRLYWKQDLPLDGVVNLRIHGLTSTVISGAAGVDDTRAGLYLSPLQTVLDPLDDVVNLVLCHHPPDWLRDQDEAEDAINGRSAIQMFGHKHRQRLTRDQSYIRFGAGAVNPDRYELGWHPAYNLIKFQVTGKGLGRILEIEARLLEWQTNPEQYRPMLTPDRGEIFRHRIPIPALVEPVAPPSIKEPEVLPEVDSDVEAAMGDVGTRNLVFRFWGLTVAQRREIALALGLIGGEEISLPEPERYGRALLRAGERGLLDALARKVAEVEARNAR